MVAMALAKSVLPVPTIGAEIANPGVLPSTNSLIKGESIKDKQLAQLAGSLNLKSCNTSARFDLASSTSAGATWSARDDHLGHGCEYSEFRHRIHPWQLFAHLT